MSLFFLSCSSCKDKIDFSAVPLAAVPLRSSSIFLHLVALHPDAKVFGMRDSLKTWTYPNFMHDKSLALVITASKTIQNLKFAVSKIEPKFVREIQC